MQKILCRQLIGNDTPHLLAVLYQRTLFSTDLGKAKLYWQMLKKSGQIPFAFGDQSLQEKPFLRNYYSMQMSLRSLP